MRFTNNNSQIKGSLITSSMNFSGIYLLINLVNNKFYVGSSINVFNRTKSHLKSMKGGYHPNIHIQRSYKKFGDCFSPILIERVNDKNKLIEREQFWIDELDATNRKIAYNIAPNAGNTLGCVMSEKSRNLMSISRTGIKHHMFGANLSKEHKFKISQSHIGIRHTEATKKKIGLSQSISVLQYSLDGKFVRKWESITEAKYKGFDKACISKCCNGQRKTHGGFIWRFNEK